MTPDQPNLLGLTPPRLREALEGHFRRRGQPAYRATQVEEWLFGRHARSFAEMTNLPVDERRALSENLRLDEPSEDTVSESADGTVKHLWSLRGGEVIESVLIPSGDRLTLCLSSQAGCALKCRFCATGWSGFGRQLTPGEIVGESSAGLSSSRRIAAGARLQNGSFCSR